VSHPPATAVVRDPRLDPEPGLLVRLCAGLCALVLRLRGGRPAAAELRRVLVVRPDDRVGNALLTIPLVRALQQALPAAKVDLLLSSARAPVAEGLPGLSLVLFDKRDAFSHPLRFLGWLHRLRASGYDAAIDAAHWHSFSLTSALLTRVATRRWTVGSARGPGALYAAQVALPGPELTEVQAKLLLVTGLGLAPPAVPPPLETALGTSTAVRDFAESTLRSRGLKRFAALNVGARKADHRWAHWKFAALARGLREGHGLLSLVLWGPGEEALARSVVQASNGSALLAPATDLDQLAAILRRASLVAANDTGPMHLAVACGAKTVALLLASDGARWSHPGPRFAGVPVHALTGTGLAGPLLTDVGAALAACARLLALTEGVPQASLRASQEDA
jgi:heptosyltransferase III